MVGRKRTSDTVKKIRGTDQRCRMSGGISSAKNEMYKLPPPAKFMLPAAKKIYKQLGISLLKAGVLTEFNLMQFCSYCNEMAKYITIEEFLTTSFLEEKSLNVFIETNKRKLGFDVITTTTIKSLQQLSLKCLKNANSIATEFGLTPASFGRIASMVKKPEDDFSKYLNS